ncbi:MAG: rhomboid family intramembrane serine protease, partial [Planctomycetaceae bacterium]
RSYTFPTTVPMFPIRDSIPSRSISFVNYVVLAICSLAFFAQLSGGDEGQLLAEQYGMVPLRLTRPDEAAVMTIREAVQTPAGIMVREREHQLAPAALPPWLTLVSSMFLHGGWMHFLGNMWFLFVFGDNVEDRFGHLGFIVLYLGTGIVAALSHLITNAFSPVPTIGASGAIAGVMGAYLVLYPHSRVQAFVPPLFMFVLPAPIFLGIWFVMQTISGVSAMGASAATGVAWWAHIGGFVAGAVLAIGIRSTSLGRPEVTDHRAFVDDGPGVL